MQAIALLALLFSVVRSQTAPSYAEAGVQLLTPVNGQRDVNIDTHLVIAFPAPPAVGSNGTVSIYDAADNSLADQLDMSVPSSPSPDGNGSTKANYTDETTYQTNIIGGMDFYFHPIIVHNNTATIYLHNNRLSYGRTYYVEISPGVLTLADGSFNGIDASNIWTFSTKPHGPPANATQVTVAGDGSGDFNTVQGAIDWAPANPTQRITILVKDGNYEELIYFQYKNNLAIRGQSRNGTVVGYPNNSAFNPPNRQGPSRRPAFSFHGVSDVQLSDFSITNYYRGQAEALLIEGTKVIVNNMFLNGSGDAFTTYGTIYVADSTLVGDGDTVLGYGSVYWLRSTIISPGAVTWTRTVQGIHGNVLVNCTIIGTQGNSTFARLPDNTGGVAPNWPYAEMVLLNARTSGIDPVGWGPVNFTRPPGWELPFGASTVRFWEYNTMDLEDNPVDLSQRLDVSKQLTMPANTSVIASYEDPAFALGGWTPVVSN